MAVKPNAASSVPSSVMPSVSYSSVPTQSVSYSPNSSSGFHGSSFRDRSKGCLSYNTFQRFPGRNGNYNNSSGILVRPQHVPPFSGSYYVPTCQICNKREHIAATCNYRSTSSQSADIEPCQICWKRYHTALTCRFRDSYTSPSSQMSAMSAQASPSQEVWIADSGATNHMTADISALPMPCIKFVSLCILLWTLIP